MIFKYRFLKSNIKMTHDKKIANLKYFYPLALIVIGDARQNPEEFPTIIIGD